MPEQPADKPSLALTLARFKRQLRYLKPARWHFIGGVVAGLLYSITSGVGLPVMVKTVIPTFFGEEQKASPRIVAWAKASFGEDYVDRLLIVACFGLPVVFLIRGLASFANRYLINYAGFVVLENMRKDVFARLQQLPLSFYHQHKSGDLVSRLMADTEQLRTTVITLSSEIVKQPATLVAAIGYLIYESIHNRAAFITLIALVSVPACVIPIRMVARRLVRRSRLVAKQTGELTAVVTETLQSPMEIQAYNLQHMQEARFAERVRHILRLLLKTVKYRSVTAPVIEFVSVCGFMTALYFGVKSGMSFEVFLALGMALYMCYEPTKRLSALNEQMKVRRASLERLEYILNAPDTVPNPPVPKPLPPFPADLAFRDVTFRYATAAPDAGPALRDVNVLVQPGEIVALVGKSGAGKSTFAGMIPRFFDPTTGSVQLRGVDLRELDRTALRDRIALVPQMPALFNATVAENIRIGKLTATDAEVREAARKAHVAEFVEALPAKYETIVGERGTTLSGGQRQRIALARAFLKNAPILILDEATSALDSESEAMVQEALRELVQGRTTFMIAHRFSSISLATRVLVFENGRVTGNGSPEQLAASHAVYRRMNELQRLE
jgi:subfamily B ATP-binding cassette protein MsbA